MTATEEMKPIGPGDRIAAFTGTGVAPAAAATVAAMALGGGYGHLIREQPRFALPPAKSTPTTFLPSPEAQQRARETALAQAEGKRRRIRERNLRRAGGTTTKEPTTERATTEGGEARQ